jgi:hypothetical protein
VGFEVTYDYLGCSASVATWWHQFHIQFAHVTNVILHVFGYLIVEDMFLGDGTGLFELLQECVVCPYHLGVLAIFFMGSTRMVLLSISTITMMYLLPQRDQMGNWPVWLENMVLRTMYVWVYMSRTFLPWRREVLHVFNGAALTLVDRMFFLVWFRCPFAVSIVLG